MTTLLFYVRFVCSFWHWIPWQNSCLKYSDLLYLLPLKKYEGPFPKIWGTMPKDMRHHAQRYEGPFQRYEGPFQRYEEPCPKIWGTISKIWGTIPKAFNFISNQILMAFFFIWSSVDLHKSNKASTFSWFLLVILYVFL
jgi:hypothetical protein